VALHVKGGSSGRRRAPKQEIAFHRAKLATSLAITAVRGR
jgi:hypothetical protein